MKCEAEVSGVSGVSEDGEAKVPEVSEGGETEMHSQTPVSEIGYAFGAVSCRGMRARQAGHA